MGFINLIKNEFIKILRKKVTVVFILIAICSIILSCILVYLKKDELGATMSSSMQDTDSAILNLNRYKYMLSNTDDAREIKILNKEIEDFEYLLDKGVENIINAEYKSIAFGTLSTYYKKLYSLDEVENKIEFNRQQENIDRLWKIIKEGTFEEYIAFNKDMLKQDYEQKIITKEEYETKIEQEEIKLKYEIGKYEPQNSIWKNSVLDNITKMNNLIENRFDFENVTYIDNEGVQKLENQKIIDEYRLKNNIIPCYEDVNVEGYSRYKYNQFANKSSIIVIGLLVIILAASSISEEISKGTIKFLLIEPCSRSEILFAKIISILIIAIILVIIISQISVLIGNIVFGANASNDYLYVKNGEVKIIVNHLYETIQYLLRIPELCVYILIGVALSTLTKNTAISTIITSALFIGSTVALNVINNFLVIDFFKYLPFSNFNLIDKILPLETYSIENTISIEMSFSFSIMVLIITSILMIITSWDSFRKKEI